MAFELCPAAHGRDLGEDNGTAAQSSANRLPSAGLVDFARPTGSEKTRLAGNEALTKVLSFSLMPTILSHIELGNEATFWDTKAEAAAEVLPLVQRG